VGEEYEEEEEGMEPWPSQAERELMRKNLEDGDD
jgi:hypothetical protein